MKVNLNYYKMSNNSQLMIEKKILTTIRKTFKNNLKKMKIDV